MPMKTNQQDQGLVPDYGLYAVELDVSADAALQAGRPAVAERLHRHAAYLRGAQRSEDGPAPRWH
jgi:hypothetical protein